MKTKQCCIALAAWIIALGAWITTLAAGPSLSADDFIAIRLQSKIKKVQPMTGIVKFASSEEFEPINGNIQLEYVNMGYNEVVDKKKGEYDWKVLQKKLDCVESHKHQAVLRFYETRPDEATTVPRYIKEKAGYKETCVTVEKIKTCFPDWRNSDYQKFFVEFYDTFAAIYDRDPRLAFLEVGFGVWAEYHTNPVKTKPGVNFPSLEFQEKFFNHLPHIFCHTPWMISEDAHEVGRSPFPSNQGLLNLKFGLFDDSFHLAWEGGYNLEGWQCFGLDRFKQSPAGGEILIGKIDPKLCENLSAPNWAKKTCAFGITFMIGDTWDNCNIDIGKYGLDCGYKFKVTAFKAKSTESRVSVMNTGVAPIYYDAYVTVNGVQSTDSLKGLLPNREREFSIQSGGKGGKAPTLTIECKRLVAGQQIDFDADLVVR